MIGQILIYRTFLFDDDALVINAFLKPIIAVVFLQGRNLALKFRDL